MTDEGRRGAEQNAVRVPGVVGSTTGGCDRADPVYAGARPVVLSNGSFIKKLTPNYWGVFDNSTADYIRSWF